MSSTEKPAADPATTRQLDSFWNQHLVPAAQALRDRGVQFFELRPNAQKATYYADHRSAADPLVKLEPGDWERLLGEMWRNEGLPELAAFAGPLMALAQKLKIQEEEQGDVSPFIYVMF